MVLGWSATHNAVAPYFMWLGLVVGLRCPEGFAGLMEMGTEMPADAPPYWQVYFMVENADKAIETTKSSGGSLVFGPLDIPTGRVATLFDPQGAAVSILESNYPEPR